MICRTCSEPMTLDALISHDARRGLHPGMPTPVVLRCRHGHTQRVSPVPMSPSAEAAAERATLRCAVCGTDILRPKGAAPRKSCSPEHTRFIARKRAEAELAHRRLTRAHRTDTPFVPFRFVVEAQPWYRGTATAFQPPAPVPPLLIPTGPDFPEIPAVWLDGFRRCYPALEEAAPMLPTFPPLDALEEGEALAFKTRKYRRRRPRPDLTPEQLMPYPVRNA